MTMIPRMLLTLSPSIIIIIISLAGIVYFSIHLFKKKYFTAPLLTRVIIGLLSALFLTTLLFPDKVIFNKKIINIYGIQDKFWDQSANYNQNGIFLTTFLNLNLDNIFMAEPKNYSKSTIEKILSDNKAVPFGESDEKINVILYLYEGFMDPTSFPIQYSKDPIPFFRYLYENYSSGTVITPVFGSGTANPEFSLLTGLSLINLIDGSWPYEQYLNNKINSLASILKENGYKTVAIHPNVKWFWNRSGVYPLMGFDDFISKDDFKNPQYGKNFIKDESLVDKIIELSDKEKGPLFTFGISIGSHNPYAYDYVSTKDNDVKVISDLPDDLKQILNTYINILNESDWALKKMIDHFSQEKEKTIIVIFGDHLPLLGDGEGVYGEVKYPIYDMTNQQELERKYSTPVVIWTNFETDKEKINLSMNCLGSKILDMAGVYYSSYFNFIHSMCSQLPVVSANFIKTKDGEFIPVENYEEFLNNSKYKDLLQSYRLLEYDLLFGKRYSLGK